MADLGGSIHVSRVDSDDFEPDEEDGGFAHLLFEDGATMGGLLDVGAGDMASLPKGAVTTWHPSPDFKEVWVFS